MANEYRYNPRLPFLREGERGNLVIDNEFVFGDTRERLPFERLARWMMTPNPQRREKREDRFLPNVIVHDNFIDDPADKIVWLGHSSFYICLNGKRLLTDPVFYNLAPVRMHRKHGLPCPIERLQRIDYILLSHGHRDHLDIPSLRALLQVNPQAEILCPLGFQGMLQRIGYRRIQEAAWWQRYDTPGITIDFLPAKHWNRRHLFDFNTTLWGSFAIEADNIRLYFAGDTGYDTHFKTIGGHYPGFDVCLMPVGAYKPQYIMQWAHTSPQEAIQGFRELGGKTFIPMHYGTYDLSDEPAGEPVRILQQEEVSGNFPGELKLLSVGEVYRW